MILFDKIYYSKNEKLYYIIKKIFNNDTYGAFVIDLENNGCHYMDNIEEKFIHSQEYPSTCGGVELTHIN